MRFMIMHKSNAYWEGGALPSAELIARVGALIGDLKAADVLGGAEGLRPSADGVRLQFSRGVRTLHRGPFEGGHELPAGFTILRTSSIEEAIEWATREAQILGDVEIDIRRVTEPWDIGVMPRPDGATARYMVLRKATPLTESGASPTPPERAALARLADESAGGGVPLSTETMRPTSRGRRYKKTHGGAAVTDGPFAESKELLGGYVIVSASSLDEADRWARRYLDTVEADEVDLRELEEAVLTK